jgi:large repetitive protein
MMKKHGWWIITLIVIAAFIGFLVHQANKPGKYDTFAQCITDSGTKFYGAWWCPHCQAQKALFGKSAKLLPYKECSDKKRVQTQECNDLGIQKYPTWEFPDGTRQTANRTFAELAAATNCPVPVTE